jgi:hypothetical protein
MKSRQNLSLPITTYHFAHFIAEDRGVVRAETNLDRFDTTCLTWRHPRLSRERLSQLLFRCYREFFSSRHALHNLRNQRVRVGRRRIPEMMGNLAMSMFVRYCTWRRTHPMSGGMRRVRLDRAADYLSLRKKAYGFELAPLPRSMQLPVQESQLVHPEASQVSGHLS